MRIRSGGGGIRTPGPLARPAAFKAAAFDRTLPPLQGARILGSHDVLGCPEGMEHRRYRDRAVLLLVVLHDRDDRAPDRYGRAVERVHVARRFSLGRPRADV